MSDKQKNVLGQDLEQCSLDPLTDGIVMDVVILMKMIKEFILFVQK